MLRLPIDVAKLSALLALLSDAFAPGGLGLDAAVEGLAPLVPVALVALRAALRLEALGQTEDADLLIGAALRGRIDAFLPAGDLATGTLRLAMAGIAAIPIGADAAAAAQVRVVRVALAAVLEAADTGISRTGARSIRLGAARALTAGMASIAGLAWLGTDWLLAVAGITAVAVLTDAATAAQIRVVGVARRAVGDAARAGSGILGEPRGRVALAAAPWRCGEDARRGADVVGAAAMTAGLVRVAIDADVGPATLPIVAALLDAFTSTVGIRVTSTEITRLRQSGPSPCPG